MIEINEPEVLEFLVGIWYNKVYSENKNKTIILQHKDKLWKLL
jgi:hypothetical protein